MSDINPAAAIRDNTRIENDAYNTPIAEAQNIAAAVTDALLCSSELDVFLEPFAGSGNFVRALKLLGYKTFAADINPNCRSVQTKIASTASYKQTLAYYDSKRPEMSLHVLSNPPFGQLDEILPAFLSRLNSGVFSSVTFLLRTTAMESAGRESIFAKYPPDFIARCSTRITWVDQNDNPILYRTKSGDTRSQTDTIGCDVVTWKNETTFNTGPQQYGHTRYYPAWPVRTAKKFYYLP
jgi:hypothetical protein